MNEIALQEHVLERPIVIPSSLDLCVFELMIHFTKSAKNLDFGKKQPIGLIH